MDTQGKYRARAVIVHRKAVTDEQRRADPHANPNPVQRIEPGTLFDPAEVGFSNDEMDRFARAGHVTAIGKEGENLDNPETIAAVASYAGPAPVPSTTERDAKTKGAAPQRPGVSTTDAAPGAAQGNTSPPATDQNRAPMAGDKPQPNVSGNTSTNR
jgi:hypothetical protein